MPQEIVKPRQTSDVWVDKHVGAKIVGLSVHTLKKLRSEKAREADRLIEGVHFVRHGGYCVRYNAELLRDYAATRSNPEAHRRAVDLYLASLPSNQPKRVGRKAKTSTSAA
jgi:hypothetical protein